MIRNTLIRAERIEMLLIGKVFNTIGLGVRSLAKTSVWITTGLEHSFIEIRNYHSFSNILSITQGAMISISI